LRGAPGRRGAPARHRCRGGPAWAASSSATGQRGSDDREPDGGFADVAALIADRSGGACGSRR